MKLIFLVVVVMYTFEVSAVPIIIGHRGVPGHYPEHTLLGYKKAIDMGVDFIEPDLVMTKDGVLIARHENEISGTTDVARKYPERKTIKTVDGQKVSGWFSEDFTLEEIKKLRTKERLEFRSHENDFKDEIPTFSEILDLRAKESKRLGRQVGVYPELKHPSYFLSIKKDLVKNLVEELKKFDLTQKSSPVFVQCFEWQTLVSIKSKINVPLIFLIGSHEEQPYDFVLKGDPRTYGDLIKLGELKKMSSVIDGIGPDKSLIVPIDANGELQKPTTLVKDSHEAGLKVHPYTFRTDREFLAKGYKGQPTEEYRQFFELGVDGVFSDFADDAIRARNAAYAAGRRK